MLNNVNLCGRLVEFPELKKTPSGISVTSFSIAVDRDYTSGEEKQTDFIKIVAWRSTAEFICRYFGKGKMIIINGTLRVRKYTTQNGENRYVTEVIANHVYFAGDKAETRTEPNTADVAADNTTPSYEEIATDMDDLPF